MNIYSFNCSAIDSKNNWNNYWAHTTCQPLLDMMEPNVCVGMCVCLAKGILYTCILFLGRIFIDFYQILKREVRSRISIPWTLSWNIELQKAHRMNVMEYYFYTDVSTLALSLRIIKCLMLCKFSSLVSMVKASYLCMKTYIKQF